MKFKETQPNNNENESNLIDSNSLEYTSSLTDKPFHINYGKLAISYNIGAEIITKDFYVSLYSNEICHLMNPEEDATKLMCVNFEDMWQDCNICGVHATYFDQIRSLTVG